MIFTTKMSRLTAVVLEHDADNVTKILLNEGVLHFVKMTDFEDTAAQPSPYSPGVSQEKIEDTRKRIDLFFNLMDHSPPDLKTLDASALVPVDLEESGQELDIIASSLHKLREKQKTVQHEIHKLEEIKRQLELFENPGKGFFSGNRYTYLSIDPGIIKAAEEIRFKESLQTLPSVYIKLEERNSYITVLIVTMKRDSERVQAVKESFNWQDTEISGPAENLEAEAKNEIEDKIRALEKQQKEAGSSVKKYLLGKKDFLEAMWSNLRMNELFYKIQSFYGKTTRTMLFSGWLPFSRREKLEALINNAVKGKCYLEWSSPRDIKKEGIEASDVPVKMNNPEFLSPFEMLVTNYAVPEYGTIDPTPFVAAAYLIMFGLMFGDAGHGIVLALTGFLGVFLTRRNPRNSMTKIFRLIIWCGFSAVAAGILFGSYFGQPWFKPLWFDYHGAVTGHASASSLIHDVYGILLITIYFGIGVIFTGLVINWINCISNRNWFRLLMDKGGLIGGWMYGAGIWTAFYFAGSSYRQLPAGNILFLGLGLPALLLMLKPPLEMYIHNRSRHGEKKNFTMFSLMIFIMEWMVELLEIFSGYLANTLSFMRVAGLGIAHVSLMTAFDQIAEMISAGDGSFSIGAVLVLIAGNALVISLEGLSAGIQSLRLNYYEFFSKYFSGTGKAYSPVTLKSNS